MTFILSQASLDKLAGVHPDLVKVAHRAIELSPVDFRISEGLRDTARQAVLVQAGASETMKSRHLTGHAVDVVALIGGQVHWDWPLYDKISSAFKVASLETGIPIEWGGDWKTLRDGCHFQLPWASYPAHMPETPVPPMA